MSARRNKNQQDNVSHAHSRHTYTHIHVEHTHTCTRMDTQPRASITCLILSFTVCSFHSLADVLWTLRSPLLATLITSFHFTSLHFNSIHCSALFHLSPYGLTHAAKVPRKEPWSVALRSSTASVFNFLRLKSSRAVKNAIIPFVMPCNCFYSTLIAAITSLSLKNWLELFSDDAIFHGHLNFFPVFFKVSFKPLKIVRLTWFQCCRVVIDTGDDLNWISCEIACEIDLNSWIRNRQNCLLVE